MVTWIIPFHRAPTSVGVGVGRAVAQVAVVGTAVAGTQVAATMRMPIVEVAELVVKLQEMGIATGENMDIGLVNARRKSMMRRCMPRRQRRKMNLTVVHLDESRLFIHLGEKGGIDSACRILASGVTNHTTGMCNVFSGIDFRVHGMIHFGNGSMASMEGCGTILVKCKNGGHKALTGVYYIPHLAVNIISLGQLEPVAYKIVLHGGFLKPWDWAGTLAANVKRASNRLYILYLNVDGPVCMAAQGASLVWHWHARYGHLNFHTLRQLAEGEIVSAQPQIDHVNQVSNGFLARKQKCATFPCVARYHATEKLELVHGDLCGRWRW
jgi:hypothetical protein